MKDWSELSDQTRAIIAAALALVVILGWGLFYKPPPPEPSQSLSTQTTAQSAGPASASSSAAAPQIVAAKPGAPAAAAVPSVSSNAEQNVTIESDLYRVVLSNRGAVARSWQLTKFTDEHDPPRTLDLIQSDASQAAGGWPFSLQVNDPQLEAAANQGLYVVTQSGAALSGTSGATLTAPAEVEFRWSDGQVEVSKRWKFDRSYTVELETTVRRNGQPVAHRVAWRGGFGDVTAFRAVTQTLGFSGSAGNMTTLAIKKLGAPGQPTVPADQPGSFDAVGIEDLYFTVAFLPPAPPVGQPVPANLALSAWQLIRNVEQGGKTTQQILPEVAAGLTTAGPQALRVFVGPKDLDTLKAVRPPLNGLVQFGWFGFIAEPLFYSLRWLHHYIPNYGWAIVIMTLAINMVLYPLKVKSWRSMQRMQKVAPEIKQIQDRYKKYSMRDPRKQEMNKEVMAVYSREGINPMGSCLPTVIQMPIWFGLYRMLTVTLELRHAPWVGWIHDLAGPDPYYILPVVMAVLMYAVTKMTPQTITDPSQQRMMALMPVMFGGMFIIFPVSSGLVLYILTSNFVAMAQQWHLNRTSPLKPPKVKKQQRAALDKTVASA